jgi:hypothetical protein
MVVPRADRRGVQVLPVPRLAEQTPRHPHSGVRHRVKKVAELADDKRRSPRGTDGGPEPGRRPTGRGCRPANDDPAPVPALNTSYLDDGVVGHTFGTLSRVLFYLQSPQVQDLGLSLNLGKCFVYQPNSRPIPHLLPVDIPFARGPTTGKLLLGAPIGSPSHCAGALEAVVKVSMQTHLLLTEMDDPQVELLLP